jgi:CRP-like cAMP-binding protein
MGGVAHDAEEARLLWARARRYAAGMQVCGDEFSCAEKQQVIASGWACDLRILHDGRRQIFSFLLPGDAIDLRRAQNVGSRAVVALTQLVVVGHPERGASEGRSFLGGFEDGPTSAEQRLYDHLVRLGRLTTRERVVHLLLEFRDRLARVGLVKDETFKVPITQEVLADALGLSVVHINRTLRELREKDLVLIKSGLVILKNRPKLIALSGYQSPEEAVGLAPE